MTEIGYRHHFIAEGKILKILTLIQLLRNHRYTITRIAKQLDTSKRTAYRYIEMLEFMEIPIDKDFEGKYFIAQGHCPLCGVTTNNTLR